MKEFADRVRNAFNIAVRGDYDRYVDPIAYEQQVQGDICKRELLAREIADIITEVLPPSPYFPQPILDLAAGTGIISAELQDRGYQVTAVDLSPALLSEVQSKNPNISTSVTDINEQLPFEDESFQGVTTVWANRFIKDTNPFLEEVKRVLKPGGTFVWPVFRSEFPLWKARAGIKQPTFNTSLAHQCREHGFEEVTTINHSFKDALRSEQPTHGVPSYIIARK